ncbi:MAG TPA: vanadium-dependent haloperoxidase, partial [Chloroflexota bacterium]
AYTLNGSRLYGDRSAGSPAAAAASAARTVLLSLFPARQQEIDSAYVSSLSGIADSKDQLVGIKVGAWVADNVLASQANDGADLSAAYTQPPSLGVFQAISPQTPLFVSWGNVTPILLQSAVQFRPPPPPLLTSSQYATDYNEVQAVGAANSTARTPDETQAALFWVENDYIPWNRVARTVAQQRNDSLDQDARLFALLNVTLFDTRIAMFAAKYHYNFWRPIQAIHAGNVDGNPDTAGDAGWTSLGANIAHPDYPSGHSGDAGAASTVLADFFGADSASFSLTTSTAPGGVFRSFASFSQMATEVSNSRVWLGVHFRTATKVGLQLGQEVAGWDISRFDAGTQS